jgi:translation initiation factor IF-1
MVKNRTGGNKTKGFSRKGQSSNGRAENLRLPTCELEQYGCVTKMFGNGMCEIYLNDNTRLIGHIRSKFSGSKKRNNLITTFSMVMVGLREWENPIKNCDILCTVDDNEIEQIKQFPQINISNLMQMKLSNESHGFKEKDNGDNIVFTNDIDSEILDVKPQNSQKFDLGIMDEIDVDDI